jgi:hypothetical protein
MKNYNEWLINNMYSKWSDLSENELQKREVYQRTHNIENGKLNDVGILALDIIQNIRKTNLIPHDLTYNHFQV